MLTLAPRGMGLDPPAGGGSIGTMAIVLGLTVRAPGFVGGRPNRAVGG
jgi:hypothetical protein